ncbi:MAG: zinc-dependent alcohol dehydrogenase [Mycobacteriales bacterium]
MSQLPALAWTAGPTAEVIEVPAPRHDGWVRVRPAYTGLCGTDLHVFAGEHSRAVPGLVVGHEFVGELAEPVGDLPAGRRVFVNPMVHCGHCDACERGLVHICRRLTSVGLDYPGAACPEVMVPPDGIYPLPGGLDLRAAALLEPLAVGVRAVRRSGARLGERVHVIGAGPVGVMVALLAKRAGAARVALSEPSAYRRSAAVALGLSIAEAPAATADVVFDATGHPTAAAQLLAWSRPAGRIVLVGAYPPGSHPVDLLGLMFGEHKVIGTRIYTRADILAAIDLLETGFDPLPLISDVVPLAEAPAALERLRSGKAMKVLVDPSR